MLEPGRRDRSLLTLIVQLFELGGRGVLDRLKQPPVVEPATRPLLELAWRAAYSALISGRQSDRKFKSSPARDVDSPSERTLLDRLYGTLGLPTHGAKLALQIPWLGV